MKTYIEDILAAPSPIAEMGNKHVFAQDIATSESTVSRLWLTRLTLIFSDVVALCTVINVLLIAGMATELSIPGLKPLVFSFLLFPLAYLSFGLYSTVVLKPEIEITSFVKANLAVIAGLCVPVLFIPRFELSMILWLCMATPLILILVPFLRVLTRLLFSRASWWGRSALVISDSSMGQEIAEQMRRHAERGIIPAYVLQNAGDASTDFSQLLNDQALIRAITSQHGISSAILSLRPEDEERFLRLHKNEPVFHSIYLGRKDNTGRIWLKPRRKENPSVRSISENPLYTQIRLLVKRIIDVVGASMGLVLCAPLFITISLLIKFTSKGPIFFKQDRMGRDGCTIKVFKFRTMHLNAEEKLKELLATDPVLRQEYEIFHKLRNDPRITSIGKILRRYSLDEFPQLLNVIRGEMSLVGPRAYIPRELPQMRGYETEVLKCNPGVTGLWQVSGRNQLSFDERVTIDVDYQSRFSLALDFYILLKTIPVVLTGNGAS